MSYAKRAKEVMDIEIGGIQRVRDDLGAPFEGAVDLILERLNGGGKVVITGLGKSLNIGQKIVSTLTSTGTPSALLHPSDAMHGDMGVLDDRDVLLAISYSGESEELLSLMAFIRARSIPIIAMTGSPESALGELSAAIIPAAVDQEACPFNMAPTTSTTAALAVGDALAIVLLEARGFRREDYAQLHPGGAIGRTLLLRVESIMRTGDRIAVVKNGDTIRDAVLAITEAKAGAVGIVDAEGKLAGIVTDGDIRRHILEGNDLATATVDSIMTPDPKVITPERLAVDVLNIFQKHNINSLLVVDGERRVVGLVDIQDLPKFKILQWSSGS